MTKFFYDRKKAFSIRKLTVGVVSLCIGSSLLVGIQSQEVSASTVSPSQIRFEYVLEAELSADERQLIQSSLPAELTETATYFVVYRPAKTGLPKTGDGVASGLIAATAGFIVLAVLAVNNKKARILSMLYITATGLALPLLEVSAVESHALAAYNQIVTIRPGDSLPDGKLRLDGYEFVGYLVEEKPEVRSQARDEKTSLSNSSQIEVPKTGQEAAETDQQVSTEQVVDKTDELVQPDLIQTGQDQASQPVVEQISETVESQKPVDQPTESPVEVDKLTPVVEETKPSEEPVQPPVVEVEEKLITSIPAQAPSHLLPTIDFQVQDKVEETALEIPEEQIETNQLPLGQSRIEEGQAGSLRISYQEVLVDGQVVARKETSREEIPSIPRKVYIGIGQVVEGEVTETNSPEEPVQPTEEPVEEKLITTIPTEAPSYLLPTIDFQVQDKVEETTLEIPEEQIETNQLPLGQSRIEEGQAGSLRISYQEVLVDGQIVARNEISREEIPSTPRKVYIGTGQVAQEEVAESKPSEEPVQPTEEPVEEKLITTIPTEAPSHHLPTVDFQVQDKVEEIALEIPEEQIETDELAIGQSRVEEGQAGSLRISYQEVLVDGQIVARIEISREEVPSIPKRTYIGTRRDEKYVAPATIELPTATIRTQEEEIAFERKEVSRDDWPLGKVEVVAGKKGKQLHTYAVIEGVETLLKTEVLEQAQAEVTYKGVKISNTTTEEVTIDFTERVISDPEQYSDYRQIEIAGEQGLKRLHKENGQLVNEEIIKPAKEQVVRVGTKSIEGQVEKESLRTIDFTRRYENNDQLEYGQTRTKQPGQSGQEKVISTYQTIKGVEGQFISSRIVPVRPVRDEIVEVGTKPQVRIEQEEPVTEYVPAPDKERDVQTVLQEGHAKETIYRTIYNLDTNSGRVTPIHLPGKVTHLGQVRRISVGTKPTVTKKVLPFTEETIPNSTLYVGERVIVRPGRAGEEITTIHYTLNPRTGETSAGLPQIQEILPVAQVVQVGTKAVDRTVETVDSRDIAFQTEYQADSSLPYLQREVLQEGSNGVERITTTRRYVRDQEVGEPTRVNEVVKAVQNRIIKVGTKPVVRRVETDFTRVYEADPNRNLNEQYTKQTGIKQETTYTKNYILNTETGEVREQAETSQVTRTARQEIVQVGTRPTTETISRNLATRYEADSTRAHGQQHTRQQGRPEITIFTTTYSVDPSTGATQGVRDTGRVTDSGQEQIIHVGTRPTTETTSRVLPIRYEADNSRTHGERYTLQQGRPKITTFTTTYSVDPRTGETQAHRDNGRMTDRGQEQIVQVGTKPVVRRVETDFTRVYEADPNRNLNEQYTKQTGIKQETTYTKNYILNTETGEVREQAETSQVTRFARQEIVQVGTRPTTETISRNLATRYEADSTRAHGQQHTRQQGRPEITTYTTTYSVDPRTGATQGVRDTGRVMDSGQEQIVQVGTRPTTETTSRVLPIRYEADNSRVHGQQHTRQQGRPEITTFTTTYSVDPSTGATQGVRDTGRVTDSGQEQIVQVGTRPVERTERVELSPITRQNANLAKGTENVIHEGSPTIRLYRTSYTVDSVSGQITTLPEVLVSETVGRAREVEIGTKEPEQPVTPPTENEESCPIIPDNSDGGTCEAPTEPTEKPSSPDLECILNPTDQCWPEETETVDQETIAQLRAKMDELLSYKTRVEGYEWHTYIDTVYKHSEDMINSGDPANIRDQIDVVQDDINFIRDLLTSLGNPDVLVETDANSGPSLKFEVMAKPVNIPTDANSSPSRRNEETTSPVTPKPEETTEPDSQTDPPVPPTPNPEQPTVPDTPPVTSEPGTPGSTDLGTTIVPEPEQPNISETEPVSPEKSEETTEETVEDVNKPLLRVVKNTPHQHFITDVRSTKVAYELKDDKNTFKKAIATLYVNDQAIERKEFRKDEVTQGTMEVRFKDLLPNVDYYIRTDLVYTDSKNVERTERLMDEVHIDFEERHFEIKNIDEVEVWKNENGKLVRKVAIKVDPNDVQNYFIKLKSDEHKDILLPVAKIEKTSLDNVTHFKLQARFTNPEEKPLKTSGYHDIVTVYLPRELRDDYSTFSKLLDAMKSRPDGTFELKQDLTASEVVLSNTDKSYLSHQFRGTLKGNGFTIHDLKVPLFNDLRGNVSDLNLKAVDIQLPKETKVGALAKQSDNATITNVHAQGHVFAENKIGGLIGEAYQTNMTNISFNGEIAGLKNVDNNMIGGIAGWLGGGKIEKGYVDATISATSLNVKAGGLVGQLENANTQILSSFATGSIATTKTKDTEVGGLVGAILKGNSQDNSIQLRDNIAAVHVVNGYKVNGSLDETLQPFSNIRIVTGKAVGENNPSASITEIDATRADQELKAWSIRPSEKEAARKLRQKNAFDIDYSKSQFALAERKQAYENMEKLLPFFTRDVIIQYGNRLEKDDELVTKKLVDVVPLVDKVPFLDILGTSTGKNNQEIPNRDKINGLLLHFADGTVKYQYLVKKKDLSRGAVTEYLILDKNISYTPEVMANDFEYRKLLGSLISEFEGITFNSSTVQEALGLNGRYSNDKEWLFLRESFEDVKSNLQAHLSELISNYNLVGLDSSAANGYLKSYISKNKAKLLLGLAYMNRWYDIQFGDVNAKNLMMKKADFFGKNVNSLEQLIRIGSMGAEMLKPKNNYALASQVIAKESIGGDLFDYLEGYRKAFAPKMTNNDWFKSSTKATIIETPSTIKEVLEKQTNPTKDVHHNGFYEKLAGENWKFKEMALILLAMPSKDIFILTDMAHTLIGMYDNNQGVPEERLQEIAKMWAGHADYLYNILPEEHKEKMFRRTITWDTKDINNDWKALDKLTSMNYSGMKHFYLPLGYVYPNESKGAHADTRMDGIYFFRHDAITDDGARVYTHEMTHIGDDNTLLLGYGKRTGLDFEVYARGLFESITWDNQDRFGINNIYDFSKYDERNYGRRLTNKTPERFKSTQDLQDYMKGYLDVIYTLDILEAEAVLGLSNSQAKQNWFNQMVTGTGNTSTVTTVNKVPTTLEQLIEDGMVSRRPYDYGYNGNANAYLEVRAFDPIYGSLNNNGTSRNEYEVRKIAFELLAEYGYENGMVPYLSDQHKKTLGQSEAYGRMKDSDLISLISKDQYENSAAFRKAMFAKRQQRLENLKPVELITKNPLNGDGYFYGATRTVSSVEEIRRLMREAVEYDANNNKYSSNGHDVREQSRVYSLKAAVLNGYLRATDDFRESIYLTNP